MERCDRAVFERMAFRIRRDAVKTVVRNGEGHIGGALSAADILAVLFGGVLNLDSEDCRERDKFILSAGHKCLALYGALAETGRIDRTLLATYNQLGTAVPCHPDASKLPALDCSTGSLGHGLPLGCGFALAARLDGRSYHTYVLMGDGEQGEGSNWEAAAVAAQLRLGNLTAIIDENNLQINGRTQDILKPSSYEARYSSFGWAVCTVDGHDVEALWQALAAPVAQEGKPRLVVARTIKGKGLRAAEDQTAYHHWNPGPEEGAAALSELETYGRERGWM